ncbi:MAG: Phosphoglucosamine mutase [Chlamydiales bacterium]|nr:Phosphoglucosamine mutase [Chlamydiales bacterium]MCH9620543.1 Phosphoglucosamine mutase [Chlamydiales bacterium]MCH9623009.1 Phosphoglucosamine mutase [Chlamydiales bacterium]
MDKLFGTDGIRGRANHFPTTPETALALGKALAQVLRQKEGRQRVIVGKDTRRSCYFFENAIIAGLCSMGVDTLMLGPLPTPGVAYVTRAYRAAAGIMISASHNPFYDNGIKIFNSEGFKLSDALEQQMEQIIQTGAFETVPLDKEVGKNKRIDDVGGRYIEHLKNTFTPGQTLGGMKIFLDCANGATYRVAPLTFWELGAEVCVKGNSPSGLNINDNCGSLHPEGMQKGVVEKGADVGIALDGDGDRLMMSDEKGNLIDGDQIMAICAKELKELGELENNCVVGTVMTNFGVVRHLESLGVNVRLTKVGDRHVLQEMLDHKASLGGEQSGHLIFRKHTTTGDGILSALQVLAIMHRTGRKLSELAAAVEKFPQILINIPVIKKPPLEELKSVSRVIGDIEGELKGKGRVLIRYSGTENLCRVMVEGEEREKIDQMAKVIADMVTKEIGTCVESPAI